MNLDIRYMLEGTPIRMRYVERWSTSRVMHREKVAEHAWFVSFYALMLTRWYEKTYPIAEPERNALYTEVFKKSTVHDLEESRTGDIHRPFKTSTPELHAALGNAAKEAAWQVVTPLFEPADPLPLMWWDTAKDDTLAGYIVQISDLLSVIAFIRQEGTDVVRWLCLDTLPTHFQELASHAYADQFHEVLEQMRDYVKEILDVLK